MIGGGSHSTSRPVADDNPDSLLAPKAVAETYLPLIRQPLGNWKLKIEVRPRAEKF